MKTSWLFASLTIPAVFACASIGPEGDAAMGAVTVPHAQYLEQGWSSDKREAYEPGDSNAGHDYGTSLTDEQRFQLIEFIKTL